MVGKEGDLSIDVVMFTTIMFCAQVQAVAEHLVAKMGEATVATYNDATFAHDTAKQPSAVAVTNGACVLPAAVAYAVVAGEREYAAGVISEYLSAEWTARMCQAVG